MKYVIHDEFTHRLIISRDPFAYLKINLKNKHTVCLFVSRYTYRSYCESYATDRPAFFTMQSHEYCEIRWIMHTQCADIISIANIRLAWAICHWCLMTSINWLLSMLQFIDRDILRASICLYRPTSWYWTLLFEQRRNIWR